MAHGNMKKVARFDDMNGVERHRPLCVFFLQRFCEMKVNLIFSDQSTEIIKIIVLNFILFIL